MPMTLTELEGRSSCCKFI